MHLELVSLLRCPVPHADGWLVAAVDRVEGRMIVDGMLGCPVCGAEFPIRDGVTWLIAPHTGSEREYQREAGPPAPVLVEDSVRLAALLAATDPSQTIALIGHDVEDAEALQTITGVRCLVLNPRVPHPPHTANAPFGVIVMSSAIPLALAQLHAASVAEHAALYVHAAVALLRTGGRLLAPVHVPMPSTLRELARDEAQWIAERLAVPSAPVPLSRRPIS